jgi:GNAT superfamily N-acetyltransferase
MTAHPPIARPATPDDAHELIRLRQVMLAEAAIHRYTAPDPAWTAASVQSVRTSIGLPFFHAWVVDHPDRPGALAATAVAWISRSFPRRDLTDTHAHIGSVCTDTDVRRRGYARACMTGLLGALADAGHTGVSLTASPMGLGLYEQLGFTVDPNPYMRLTL